MIEAIFIAHTSACCGWDLNDIFKGSIFKKSARTWRFPKDESVRMLDWDFRRVPQRGLYETWMRHLELARTHKLDVIMSPDLWPGQWSLTFELYQILKKLAPRVVMPVHVAPNAEIDAAWPMGVWTRDYVSVTDVQEQVSHLLGGSPHAQLKVAGYFPNLRTVDGNQAFWCAVHHGKYWKDRWTKPGTPMSNEACFRESVRNMTEAWEHAGL